MCLNGCMATGGQSTVISLRLRPEIARVFKIEAASRGLKLNALCEKMLQVYRQNAGLERTSGGGGSHGRGELRADR